jgi:hypothetical protein
MWWRKLAYLMAARRKGERQAETRIPIFPVKGTTSNDLSSFH